jgi:hypothetical protein
VNRTHQLVGAAVWFAVGAVALLAAGWLAMDKGNVPASAVWPFWIGGGVALLIRLAMGEQASRVALWVGVALTAVCGFYAAGYTVAEVSDKVEHVWQQAQQKAGGRP